MTQVQYIALEKSWNWVGHESDSSSLLHEKQF